MNFVLRLFLIEFTSDQRPVLDATAEVHTFKSKLGRTRQDLVIMEEEEDIDLIRYGNFFFVLF